MSRVRLGDVVERIKDPVDKDNTDLIYYVGGEHFTNRAFKVTNKGFIKGSTIGPAFNSKFKSGDVLLMSRNPHLRKAGMVEFDGICSDVSYVIRTRDENVLMQRFIPLLFQTDMFWEFAEKNKKGSTNFFLNWKDFEQFEFELPEIEKQAKLVEMLWSMVDTMDSYEDMLLKQDELIKSQFIELFGDVSKNDKSLKECLFGDYVSKMNLGPFGSDLKNDCFVEKENGDCMVYEQKHAIEKTMDLPTRYITKEKHEKLKKFEVKSGDILVSCRGTIGQCYIIPQGSPVGVIHPSLMMIRPKSTVNTRFLLFLLEDILSRQDEQGSGVKMAIKASELSKIKTINPGIELQNKFFEVIQQIDKSKFEIEKSLADLKLLFQKIVKEQLEN